MFMSHYATEVCKCPILSLLKWLTKNKGKQWNMNSAKRLIESLEEPIIKRNFEYLFDLKNNK